MLCSLHEGVEDALIIFGATAIVRVAGKMKLGVGGGDLIAHLPILPFLEPSTALLPEFENATVTAITAA